MKKIFVHQNDRCCFGWVLIGCNNLFIKELLFYKYLILNNKNILACILLGWVAVGFWMVLM